MPVMVGRGKIVQRDNVQRSIQQTNRGCMLEGANDIMESCGRKMCSLPDITQVLILSHVRSNAGE